MEGSRVVLNMLYRIYVLEEKLSERAVADLREQISEQIGHVYEPTLKVIK